MADIEQRHFTAEPVKCLICDDPILYKNPPSQTSHGRITNIVYRVEPVALSGHRKEYGQTLLRTSDRPPRTAADPRRRRRARKERRLASRQYAPSAPSSYRGARYFLGRECPCRAPVCAECTEKWRRGAPRASCPRYYEREQRCLGCNVKVTFGIKSRSFITGPDRERYFELYLQRLSSLPCRNVFPGAGGTPSHCPHGARCHYSHVGVDGVRYQQHQPDHRQRQDKPVLIYRPALAFPPADLPIIDLEAEFDFEEPDFAVAATPPGSPIYLPAGAESDSDVEILPSPPPATTARHAPIAGEENWDDDPPHVSVLQAIRERGEYRRRLTRQGLDNYYGRPM